MPRVLVYEHLTACDIGRDPASPDHGMYREGRAMRDAVAADLAAIPGVGVELVEGLRPEDAEAAVGRLSATADRTLLIAPEFDFILETLAASVPAGRWLGSSLEGLATCRYKPHLGSRWSQAGVPTPPGELACDGGIGRYPCVIKPVDGAGSAATYLCTTEADYHAQLEIAYRESPGDPWVQQFVPGRPASVAFLIGPGQVVPLCPTFQHLTDDGRFQYRGGELPIPPALAARAVALGRRAVECVPGLAGYVGVDLILGDAADGSADYAIEINPRLTTSYVGLRALADFNIARAMLDVIDGRPVGKVRWKLGRVRFTAAGPVEYDPTMVTG